MKEPYLEVTFRHGRPIAAYSYLPRRSDQRSVRTRRVDPGLVIDFTADGQPIGIEITAPRKVSLAGLNLVLLSRVVDWDLTASRLDRRRDSNEAAGRLFLGLRLRLDLHELVAPRGGLGTGDDAGNIRIFAAWRRRRISLARLGFQASGSLELLPFLAGALAGPLVLGGA
jgi:hypothetical protein